MAIPPGGTPLDIAAIIDRVLKRNINFPLLAVSTTPVTLDVTNRFVTVDATGGNRVVNLPSAVTAKAGMSFWVIRIDSSANTVTLTPAGGETINGAASYSIGSQYNAVQLVSDGTNWVLFSGPAAFALPATVSWTFAGQLATDQDANIPEWKAPSSQTFTVFDADVRVAPAGTSILVDWAINGVIDSSARVTIAIGATYGSTTYTKTLAAGDLIKPVVTQVGSQTPGQTMLMRARGL